MVNVHGDGPAPMIKEVADQIGIREKIDSLVDWSPSQCTLSPGQQITSMVMNTLEGRTPLYRMEEFMENTDVEKCWVIRWRPSGYGKWAIPSPQPYLPGISRRAKNGLFFFFEFRISNLS